VTELPFQFPILALVPDYGGWAVEGLEMVEHFMTEELFTDVSSFDLKKRPHTAMLLVDVTGCCWRVLRVTRIGIPGTGMYRLLNLIFRDQHLVRYEIEEAPTVPFEEVRRRVCESILSHPDMYRDDEAIAGEDAPPRDEQEMLEEVAAAARAASNMLELIDVFDTLGREG
jgi:hypothetical protein